MLKQQAEDEKHRLIEEVSHLSLLFSPFVSLTYDLFVLFLFLQAQAARLRGTAVTAESFLEWKTRFLSEEKARKDKEEEDRLKSLAPKEREDFKRAKAKLSGK